MGQFGAGQFGDGVWATHFLLQVKKDAVRSILEAFAGCDAVRVSGKALLDTARIYQSGTPEADTETVLGEIFRESPALRDFFYVATKANVMMPPHRSLARDSVIEQCDTNTAKPFPLLRPLRPASGHKSPGVWCRYQHVLKVI